MDVGQLRNSQTVEFLRQTGNVRSCSQRDIQPLDEYAVTRDDRGVASIATCEARKNALAPGLCGIAPQPSARNQDLRDQKYREERPGEDKSACPTRPPRRKEPSRGRNAGGILPSS
jgi:hypothetical protein